MGGDKFTPKSGTSPTPDPSSPDSMGQTAFEKAEGSGKSSTSTGTGQKPAPKVE